VRNARPTTGSAYTNRRKFRLVWDSQVHWHVSPCALCWLRDGRHGFCCDHARRLGQRRAA
jgi:hypothetical protein